MNMLHQMAVAVGTDKENASVDGAWTVRGLHGACKHSAARTC
jgi:hypothetical protein